MSTIQTTITEIARKHPNEGLTSLNRYLTEDLLRESHGRLRKRAAPGVDGKTADAYGLEIEKRLPELIAEIKTGRYHALPAKRGYIPKPGKDQKRPLGIPAVEDKVVQKAVTAILEPIYEQEFHPFSYGFRPGRGAHDATRAMVRAIWEQKTGWIVEVDIRKFFDTLSHSHLRELLRKRVRDGVILRLIDKWLKAGVMEDGAWQTTAEGTPQGGIISPLLANLYLHEVLDEWFVKEIQPRLKGRSFLIRYADDFVMGFESEDDARRVMEVLPKRMGRFGLSLNMEKTRKVDFRKPDGTGSKPETFDFLGFTHYWGQNRRGQPCHKLKTAKDRLARSCRVVHEWCRKHLHLPVSEQCRQLNWKLRGHYGYYGFTHNIGAMMQFYEHAILIWRRWLSRRSGRYLPWSGYQSILTHNPLFTPRIFHNLYASCERSV